MAGIAVFVREFGRTFFSKDLYRSTCAIGSVSATPSGPAHSQTAAGNRAYLSEAATIG